MKKRPLTIEEQLKEDERLSLRLRINEPVYGSTYELLKLHAARTAAASLPNNPHTCGYWNAAAGCFQRVPPPSPTPI